jgi:hypothetical protein
VAKRWDYSLVASPPFTILPPNPTFRRSHPGPGWLYCVCMKTIMALHLDRPALYRLRLQGRVNVDWTDWLMDAAVAFDNGEQATVTTITGAVRDQAALFGLLSFVRDLGFVLLAVEFVQSKKETAVNTNLLRTVFNAVALAMGIAVIVTNIVSPLSANGAMTLLAFGIAALAIAALQK